MEKGPLRAGVWTRNALAVALALGMLFASSSARSEFTVTGDKLQERVNGALAMMQYSISPDITSSSLSISSGEGGTNGMFMTQFGGGFTWSKSFPLYLEGNAAYSRYDPVFILSQGAEQRSVPVQWNSLMGTVGVGWDFPIGKELVLRPMANFSLGRVTSDLRAAGRIIEGVTGQDIEFLEHGKFNAVGYGGSVMLDYEHYREAYEIDVEARLTNVWLQSYGGTWEAVQGWRWRRAWGYGPDGARQPGFGRWTARSGMSWSTPSRAISGRTGTCWASITSTPSRRYRTRYQRVEQDPTRWRLIGRFRFGENVRGWGVGLGISF